MYRPANKPILVNAPVLQRHRTLEMPARFDVHEVAEFTAKVEALLDEGSSLLTLDAQAVRHIDHSGLETLQAIGEMGVRHGAQILVQPSTTLLVALELTGSSALSTDVLVSTTPVDFTADSTMAVAA